MQLFIGFTGVKRAGKTTAFNFIKEEYPQVEELALAEKLKTASSEAFNIPKEVFSAVELKERELEIPVFLTSDNVSYLITFFGFTPDYDKHIRPHIGKILYTPRQVAQYVGTEILRNVDPDIHCKSLVANLPNTGIFIVTDIRFPNEYSFFQERYKNSFYPYYICNNRAELAASSDSHASEQHVFDIARKCQPIDNNAGLEDLRKLVLTEFQILLEIYDKGK